VNESCALAEPALAEKVMLSGFVLHETFEIGVEVEDKNTPIAMPIATSRIRMIAGSKWKNTWNGPHSLNALRNGELLLR
jgi:hypothetical protein